MQRAACDACSPVLKPDTRVQCLNTHARTEAIITLACKACTLFSANGQPGQEDCAKTTVSIKIFHSPTACVCLIVDFGVRQVH